MPPPPRQLQQYDTLTLQPVPFSQELPHRSGMQLKLYLMTANLRLPTSRLNQCLLVLASIGPGPAAPSARSGIPIKHISEALDKDDGHPPLVRDKHTEEGGFVFTDCAAAVALERMERMDAVDPAA